ncbi:MAG: sulfotransferase [Parvularculaceae bacterium]|nr:sulfotransferase [Parvularculaceae bacterium]
MSAVSDLPTKEDDIVFICGALRSGTTLLRIMVNHHPQLSNPGEMDFLFEPPPFRE